MNKHTATAQQKGSSKVSFQYESFIHNVWTINNIAVILLFFLHEIYGSDADKQQSFLESNRH